jgi:hypothetical protein
MAMLAKVKLAKRIQTTVFDSELLDLILAALKDIEHAGVTITYTAVTDEHEAVTDYVVDDALVSRAVITYCVMNFGSPDDYDRLKASYDEQKGQLRESTGYGLEVVG